jgi:excisionase family DNA binding protein
MIVFFPGVLLNPLGLLKPTEVAKRLAVSRTWVYDAAKAGRIPAVRIGGDDGPLRFVAEDVDPRSANHGDALVGR